MVTVNRPTKLAEALDILAEGNCAPFAGGTDLMVQGIENRYPEHKSILFVDDMAELNTIESCYQLVGPSIAIGAGVTLAQLINHDDVPFMLKQAAEKIAAPALRNRATLVGNVCNASPAGDTLPPLYLLDAIVEIVSREGKRQLPIAEFILGPGKTALVTGEMVSRIIVPQVQFDDHFYHKVGTRAANALTKLSVVAAVRSNGGVVEDWRICFGAVGPTVIRSTEFEQTVIGSTIDEISSSEKLQQIIEHYSKIITPIDDQRSTAHYRKSAALNLLRRWVNNIG